MTARNQSQVVIMTPRKGLHLCCTNLMKRPMRQHHYRMKIKIIFSTNLIIWWAFNKSSLSAMINLCMCMQTQMMNKLIMYISATLCWSFKCNNSEMIDYCGSIMRHGLNGFKISLTNSCIICNNNVNHLNQTVSEFRLSSTTGCALELWTFFTLYWNYWPNMVGKQLLSSFTKSLNFRKPVIICLGIWSKHKVIANKQHGQQIYLLMSCRSNSKELIGWIHFRMCEPN